MNAAIWYVEQAKRYVDNKLVETYSGEPKAMVTADDYSALTARCELAESQLAAMNLAPTAAAILKESARLTARCEALTAALLKYGYHHESCDFVQSELPCTCGLEALRSSVADGADHV